MYHSLQKSKLFIILQAIILWMVMMSYAFADAKIFSYQRIGEDQYPETNTRLDQFKEHIALIKASGYSVIPAKDILERSNENVVAITFDGAYASAIERAIPILEDSGLPYTIFLPMQAIKQGAAQYASLPQIKTIAKSDLAELGVHPADYAYFANNDRVFQINKAKALYRDTFDKEPRLFAYPFGEHDLDYTKLLRKQNFDMGFAMHSGAISKHSNAYDIPRFVMTESYADEDRFLMLLNSEALPVKNISPASTVISDDLTEVTLTLDTPLENSSLLACYLSELGKAPIVVENTIIQIEIEQPILEERMRLNCTYPVTENGETYWMWYGRLFTRPN